MILNHYIMWPRRIATCFCIMIQWVSTMTATKDATRVRATLDIAYLHRAAGGRGGGGVLGGRGISRCRAEDHPWQHAISNRS